MGRPIDYRLRPAKNIERKMLANAFRRLSEFGHVEEYRYIGFGALYFSDFILFHRALGFRHMISIEREGEDDPAKQERYKFNSPFKCVDIEFGSAKSVLPRLNWGIRSIVWLDYIGALSKEVLSDVAFVCSQATQGSLLLISVNASSIEMPENEDDEEEPKGKGPLENLKRAVGSDKVPPGINNKALSGWRMAEVCRTIVQNEIEEALKERNGGLPKGSKFRYQQLFNFHYADGAKMLTVGGILYDEGQESVVSRCGFEKLDFYRPNEESYTIDPPLLTFKEIRALDKVIPLQGDACDIPVLPEDIRKYEEIYRYFPHFTEAEI